METLSCVDRYQFAWHVVYLYDDDVQPLLPAGTVLHVIGIHNNTAANKFNPDPDNLVTYGARTIDDMSFAWMSWYTSPTQSTSSNSKRGTPRPTSRAISRRERPQARVRFLP